MAAKIFGGPHYGHVYYIEDFCVKFSFLDNQLKTSHLDYHNISVSVFCWLQSTILVGIEGVEKYTHTNGGDSYGKL
jgi:hypothetical protein